MILRSLSALLATTAFVTATPVLAQSIDGSAAIQTTFRGAVAAGCRVSTATTTTASNASVSALSPGSADIAISQLVDDDGTVVGSTVVLSLPAVCNQAHTLNLESLRGGLQGNGPPLAGGPFRTLVPYTVTVDWAGGSQLFATGDESLSLSIGDAATGPVTVTIQIPAGGAPLASGTYSDELVLELGAAG